MAGWFRCSIYVIHLETHGIPSKESDYNCYSSSVCSQGRQLNSSGSTFADYVLSYFISPDPDSSTPPPNPPSFFRFLQSLGIQTAAFQELTTTNMKSFNETTPNRPDIKYFSFGASCQPTWGSVFRTSHDIIASKEGPNDGLVSVSSAMWGEYKGTISNVNHLEIINWVRFAP